jgi:hypothetical protein
MGINDPTLPSSVEKGSLPGSNHKAAQGASPIIEGINSDDMAWLEVLACLIPVV